MALRKITAEDAEAFGESASAIYINALAEALDAAVKALRGSAGPDEISNARRKGEDALKYTGVK